MRADSEFTYHGQFAPPVDQFLHERYFFDGSPGGVFVECGAFDGITKSSCKFFEETLGWFGHNLEPVPWIYEKLAKNRPSSDNHNVALWSKTETKEFSAVVHPSFGRMCTNGSLRHESTHLDTLVETGCTLAKIHVKCQTWNDFCIQANITLIDLLVLDVEGVELDVLSGFDSTSVLPKVICIEHGHTGAEGIRRKLARIGYEFDESSHANLYFVRRDFYPILLLKRIEKIQSSTVNRFLEESSLIKDELSSAKKELLQGYLDLNQEIAKRRKVELLLSQAYEDLDETKGYLLALGQSYKELRWHNDALQISMKMLLQRLSHKTRSANALITRIRQVQLF